MKILLATDLSGHDDVLIQAICTLAESSQAECTVIHVAAPNPDFVGYEAGPQSVRDQMAEEYHKEHKQIKDLASRLKTRGFQTAARVVQGATVPTILRQAGDMKADMIVVGSHGHGAVHHLLVGSTSEGLLKKASCPVLVVPTRD